MAENEKKYTRCYCSACNQQTKHLILAEDTEHSDTDDYWWKTIYRLVKCCGCDHLSFDTELWDDSYMDYDADGNLVMYEQHVSYPEKEGTIKPINVSWNFPTHIYHIYSETVTAINNTCYRLAAAGFRAVIEAICIDKNISAKNLEGKINALHKAGIITKADRDRLHSIRFIGNDSIHEMKLPSKDAVLLVLEIINGILTNLYVWDKKVKEHLECPIGNMSEFIKLLDKGLSERKVGDVDILKNFLPENRRLIKEDMKKFEQELQGKIKEGSYCRLSLCKSPAEGRSQQYKVENIEKINIQDNADEVL